MVVFGDGPVVMREAKRHGLLAVGILSDEIRRYGLNMKKRSRLILVGQTSSFQTFSCFNLAEYLAGSTAKSEIIAFSKISSLEAHII